MEVAETPDEAIERLTVENAHLLQRLNAKEQLFLTATEEIARKQKLIVDLRAELRSNVEKLNRRKSKVNDLKLLLTEKESEIKTLKKARDEEQATPVCQNPILSEIVKRCSLHDIKSKVKYDQILKDFCVTFEYWSPRAYQYVRESFNYALPHPNTIYLWVKPIFTEPGTNYKT